MLEIRKTAISLDEADLINLERILTDNDEMEALKFINSVIYARILHSQKGKLKSHLDSADPIDSFIQHNK
jgi:hypothetical protein